jgi:molecular chaperone GrpE
MTSLPHKRDDEVIAAEAVDMATLLKENESLQEENKRLQDRLLRALAEAENVRRQAERAVTEARQYAVAEFARELLPVADNLERTLMAAEKISPRSTDYEVLLEGVRATLRAFMQTLERFGVRPIDALGKAFDPNFHEAVAIVDVPSQPPGTVIEVVEQGYTIRDRLLRPARVVVSREAAKPTKNSEPEENELGSLWGARPIDP